MPFSPGLVPVGLYKSTITLGLSKPYILFLTPHSRRCYCLFHNKIICT